MQTVLVLMTTHNNENQCLESIRRLSIACARAGAVATVYLANSGKRALNLNQHFQQITIREFETSEDTFWAKGMRRAWEMASRDGVGYEYVLWLNDDTILFEKSLDVLWSVLKNNTDDPVVVGTCSSDQGVMTYGGLKRKNSLFRLHFSPTPPDDKSFKCDSFNGNLVLMRYKKLWGMGGFPDGYTHLRADLHFGLAHKARGGSNLVAPGIQAICQLNNSYKRYVDLRGLSLRDKIIVINHPKFGPLKEHFKFSLAHGGILGICYALAPFLRAVIGR